MERRAYFIIPAFVAIVVALGIWMDRSERFAPLQGVMRSESVPAKALESGPLSRVLRTNGMLHNAVEEDGAEVFRVSGDMLPVGDSVQLAQEFLHPGWPLISITVNDTHLNEPERGIFANYEQRWEVPGHVSFFQGDELIGQANCGVRLHGNASRRPSIRAKHGSSVRLYFRETYGGETLPLDRVLGEGMAPDARLIVRGESPLSSALSFDIVRQIGGQAPMMRPTLYVLNGELQRMFSLSEHLSKDMWSHRLGHRDFSFYRNRGSKTKYDKRDFEGFDGWLRHLPLGVRTVEEISERVDIENYIRHIFSILWCGTDDWAQGAAYFDRTEEHPVWRWVNWDMDRSFRDSRGRINTSSWDKSCFALIVDGMLGPDTSDGQKEAHRVQMEDARGILFAGLLKDDPEFKKLFVERATGFMNHEINELFLNERIRWYSKFSGVPGISTSSLKQAEDFLANRSEFFREDMATAFRLDSCFPIDVIGPEAGTDGQIVIIDGRQSTTPYRGYYFPGQTITVESTSPAQEWTVDGVATQGPRIEHILTGPMRIQLHR